MKKNKTKLVRETMTHYVSAHLVVEIK